jgi:hypothetical protein
MGAEQPPVPLPPPPLHPHREPDWQVSWTLVGYTAVAGSVEFVASRAISALTHPGTAHTWLSAGTLESLGHSVLGSALLGLGVVLAERRCPATWPRTGRWALGAGLAALTGGLVPSPITLRCYASLGMGLWSMLGSMLIPPAIGALMAAFNGFYIARALRRNTHPWQRLPLAGMEAQLMVVGALLGVWVVGAAFAGRPGLQLPMVAVTVALGALDGLLMGCAFAAGVRRADGEVPAVYA